MSIPTARIRKKIVVGQSFGKMTVIRFATDEEIINHKLQSKEQFEKLIKENCFYCGLEPREKSKNKWYNGSIVANGIDRVDNQKGYSVENCVPCCRQCNFAKRDLSIEDFKNWATKLVNNLNSKEF